MKIIYLLAVFPKLSETFILNEVIELLKKGHDVQIFSIRRPNEELIHGEFEHFNLANRTHYFAIKKITNLNKIRLFKYFIKGCIQDFIELKTFRNILKTNLKIAYFAILMDEMDVDLIHTHFRGDLARKLSKLSNKQYTMTNHAFEIFNSPDFKKMKTYISDAKLVFTPSMYNKKYLIDNTGCDKNKIKVIHATINPEKFTYLGSHSGKEIVMGGRLVEKKGMKYMIFAMNYICEKYPNTRLKIIGDGPLLNELKELVQKNNFGNNITFLGSISDREYYDELRNSVIAVLPCVITENGDRDVCPLTLQEAMSMELPVVSTNVHSIPELIDDGISGILVPPNDAKELAYAVIKLLDDSQLRQKMGVNGRDKILKEFNIERQVEAQINEWMNI